jgi:hypothetical protein
LIVELSTESLPTDAAGRSALAAFTSSLLEQLPGLDELLLGPAPTAASASVYSAALASLRDAAKAKASSLVVAGELDGTVSPKATLKALGKAFLASGRELPIMDELAFRPAPAAATNAWTIGNYAQLEAALSSAFDGTAEEGSTLPILVDGVALATAIPADKASAYPSPPGPASGVTEKAQKRAYNEVLRSAVCMPNVSGVVLRRLVDKPGSADQASDQSGLYYADGSAKTSASAVAETAALAGRGTLEICPGLRTPVAAKTLVYPLSFSSLSAPKIMLACTRDCLYLVTLESTDGKPVSAKRGALRADVAPIKVKLPQSAALRAGARYRLRVRLVAQVNPGPVRQYRSPVITAD